MRKAFLWFLLLNFVGCAQVPQVTNITGKAISDIHSFEVLGRFSVKHAEENTAGKIRWQHEKNKDNIFLMAPLGQTVAQIIRTEEGVRLIKSDKKSYYATDVESLTEKVLGWRLPLQGLKDWVLGKKTSGESRELNRNPQTYQLEKFEQNGWVIEYLRYQSTEQFSLPVRLNLSRMSPELEIRLVIDEWIIR